MIIQWRAGRVWTASAMPDKIAKKTLTSALAALGEGQFAMSEASVHASLVFEQNFDMPHAANFLPFKADDLLSHTNGVRYSRYM